MASHCVGFTFPGIIEDPGSLDGIMISPMKNGDIECILGAKIDPVFGPIVMFGLGGIYAEVMKDIVFAEAPVRKQKAEQMILSLKSKDIFYGARGKPPVDINSLLNAIINLSNFKLFVFLELICIAIARTHSG